MPHKTKQKRKILGRRTTTRALVKRWIIKRTESNRHIRQFRGNLPNNVNSFYIEWLHSKLTLIRYTTFPKSRHRTQLALNTWCLNLLFFICITRIELKFFYKSSKILIKKRSPTLQILLKSKFVCVCVWFYVNLDIEQKKQIMVSFVSVFAFGTKTILSVLFFSIFLSWVLF